jgi:uncharacterized protein (TIGR03492 family)
MHQPAAPSILFTSNGHGEDAIAAAILDNLMSLNAFQNAGFDVMAMPLVGHGKAYEKLGVDMVGPLQLLPTDGFARQSFNNLNRDIKAGMMNLIYRQASTLKSLRGQVSLPICVGDIMPLTMVGWFLKMPSILVATAKSDYYVDGKRHHYGIEVLLMKRYAKIVYARDKLTADSLLASGVNAKYVGNVMMDCLDVSDNPIPIDSGKTVIGILPGSRDDAYDNFERIVKVLYCLTKQSGNQTKFVILVAVAGNLDVSKLEQCVVNQGLMNRHLDYQECGCELIMVSDLGDLRFYKGRFGDIISASDIVIGLSGTGNEQAVGMGKPVVTFPGGGTQFTKKFAQDQVKLLGQSVSLVDYDPDNVAKEVLSILNDPRKRAVMAHIGRERMGVSGAARKIAEDISKELRLINQD